MTSETDDISECRIVEVEGRPNSPDRLRESSLWVRFRSWLFPNLKKNEELGHVYAQSRAEGRKSKVRKTAERAAEIAASKDLDRQRKRILDQKEIHEFNAAVNDIFANDGLPAEAKELKFAKLIEKNPQILEQLDKVNKVLERLALIKGLSIKAVEKSEKSLSPEQKGS